MFSATSFDVSIPTTMPSIQSCARAYAKQKSTMLPRLSTAAFRSSVSTMVAGATSESRGQRASARPLSRPCSRMLRTGSSAQRCDNARFAPAMIGQVERKLHVVHQRFGQAVEQLCGRMHGNAKYTDAPLRLQIGQAAPDRATPSSAADSAMQQQHIETIALQGCARGHDASVGRGDRNFRRCAGCNSVEWIKFRHNCDAINATQRPARYALPRGHRRARYRSS